MLKNIFQNVRLNANFDNNSNRGAPTRWSAALRQYIQHSIFADTFHKTSLDVFLIPFEVNIRSKTTSKLRGRNPNHGWIINPSSSKHQHESAQFYVYCFLNTFDLALIPGSYLHVLGTMDMYPGIIVLVATLRDWLWGWYLTWELHRIFDSLQTSFIMAESINRNILLIYRLSSATVSTVTCSLADYVALVPKIRATSHLLDWLPASVFFSAAVERFYTSSIVPD